MIYILLCGGIGKRCNQYSLPKPLNYIYGRHLIEYMIESIPSNHIYIIYNQALDQYNFKEIVINKFKTKTFDFSVIPFLTRGAVETALIGIQTFTQMDKGEPIVFIDNDNIHSFPDLSNLRNHFICYGHDYIKQNYSFISIDQDRVTAIEEKVKISDCYCCGLYGFKNTESFLDLANELIELNMKTKQEFYFSQLYKLLIINKGEPITPIYVENTKHLGTYQEIENQIITTPKKLRICFDLDNTLVTNPEKPGDYSTVKPIRKMISLLQYFKSNGHEIIIYTARRMETHKSNIGRVMKDIALITFNTLDKFGIEYDEIIFGKPIADIYIDDRAMNPYYNNISMFGFFDQHSEFIPNKIENNKYNKIEKIENQIRKIGPAKYICGELFFYQAIQMYPTVSQYFPNLIRHVENKQTDEIEIYMDYVSGIPLYFFYANQTLTFHQIDQCFDILDKLHHSPHTITISHEKIKSNYIDKIKDRFLHSPYDYPFENANTVLAEILEKLEKYYDAQVVPVIHGDFWFSNILLTYTDEIRMIDMKGQVYGELTLNGDAYYDYGKMYQSILGYDLILNKKSVSEEYLQKMHDYFLKKCIEKNLNVNYLFWVTKSLIFGTFHFYSSSPQLASKTDIWNWFTRLHQKVKAV